MDWKSYISNQKNKIAALSAENISSKLFYIFLLAAFFYLFYFFWMMDFRRILSVTPDDAAYFFKIAENVAVGDGLTYDGINKTNGFQPLWLYFLIPVYYIYKGSPENLFRISLILQLVLLTSSAILTYSILSKFFTRSVSLISSILFFVFVFFRSANGMESALLIFMLSVLFAYGSKGQVFILQRPGRQFLFGVFLGLVMLSRLDTIFLAICIYIFLFLKLLIKTKERQRDCIRLLMIMTGSTIIISPYLIYNYFNFGSIIPISGALKSSFPHISLSGYALSRLGKNSLPIFLGCGYLLWFFLRIKKLDEYKSSRQYFRLSMAIMSGAVLLHSLHTILFMKWAIFNWHFIPYVFFGSIVISEPIYYFFFQNPLKIYRLLYWLGIVMLVLYVGLKIHNRYDTPRGGGFRVASYKAALWARENTNKTDIFAMKDAGNFGFFSLRSVINLDGIVNNFEYQDALKDQRLKEYLKRKGVKYLVQHAFRNREDINRGHYITFTTRYFSHKYMTYSDEILLKKADEVYRSPSYYDGPFKTVFVIWKLSED